MVELLWLAAAHVYIEQCIDTFNVFKVNYVTRSQSDVSWGLTVIFLKFNHVWFLISFLASFPDGASAIGCNVEVLN